MLSLKIIFRYIHSYHPGLIPSVLTALIVDIRIRLAARRPLPVPALWLEAILLLLAGNSLGARSDRRHVERRGAALSFRRNLVLVPVLLYPPGPRTALERRRTRYAWRFASNRRR